MLWGTRPILCVLLREGSSLDSSLPLPKQGHSWELEWLCFFCAVVRFGPGQTGAFYLDFKKLVGPFETFKLVGLASVKQNKQT